MAEFEDHQKPQNLGNLPEPISAERGEYPFGPSTFENPGVGGIMDPRYRIPPDIRNENAVRQLPSIDKSPSISALVDSTFDTRPVNAWDFHSVGSGILNPGNGSAVDTLTFTHTIPNGYIGILRGFKYKALALAGFRAVSFDNNTDFFDIFSITLLNDNIIVPNFEQMKLGQVANVMIPTHVIGNENKSFTLKLEASDYYMNTVINALLTSNMRVSFELYGNHLLSRGLPVNFENISQTTTGK